ncbi:hypothetical protein Lalb_Chr17g0342131 [Lupinus albus]|uniref:S-protein homolog n=1 Tax=Lupinus albus TaxID=3870 RepID=A0A6A4NPT7_LUPAL|nr:hypothetical protein Lalb_Chr17g0342131 [Lupinus albus]
MDVKAIYNLTLFLLLIFVPFSNSSLWGEMLHPKLGVKITSKIPGGVVRVKCISSESDIKEGYLESSSAKPFIFEVELKFLTTVRYNCLLTQGCKEIGQFLGFRSGSYCEKGCTWEVFPTYALRISSKRGFVNQTYKPIGSPDDHSYDFT